MSLPLWRMYTQDTWKRSSYHRLALQNVSSSTKFLVTPMIQHNRQELTTMRYNQSTSYISFGRNYRWTLLRLRPRPAYAFRAPNTSGFFTFQKNLRPVPIVATLLTRINARWCTPMTWINTNDVIQYVPRLGFFPVYYCAASIIQRCRCKNIRDKGSIATPYCWYRKRRKYNNSILLTINTPAFVHSQGRLIAPSEPMVSPSSDVAMNVQASSGSPLDGKSEIPGCLPAQSKDAPSVYLRCCHPAEVHRKLLIKLTKHTKTMHDFAFVVRTCQIRVEEMTCVFAYSIAWSCFYNSRKVRTFIIHFV